MTLAEVSDPRPKGLVDQLAGRRAWEQFPKRCPVNTEWARITRTNRFQKRAAVTHIFHNILEIDRWQYTAAAISVENHQVEFFELHFKQFRVGNEISESSLIGVPSCFSGGGEL